MNRFKSLFLLLVAVGFFSSCSGPKNGVCSLNCGGGGNGTVIVTVTSTPSQTFYFPYLSWQITSVTLINASSQSTILQAPLSPLDFARLQSDSQVLNLNESSVSVAAGTYTSVKIQLAPTSDISYVYNSAGSTLFTGCATAGAVCPIPAPSTNKVPGFAGATVTVPVSFTVAANQNTGFSLNFDLSKAVTSASGMTFDFTQPGAITLAILPRTGQMSGGSLDSLENFTGIISATTSTTFDMFSISSDTRTFSVLSTAKFDDPFNVCTTANFACLATNQNVSVDAFVNSDGTLTAYEVEFLDKSAMEIEGIIVTPISGNKFTMVVTNGMPVNSVFFPGTLVTVTVNAASTYSVDPKNLFTIAPTVGFQSSADLVVGQSVMLQGGSTDFTNNGLSGYSRTLLRYSSIGGTVQTVGSPDFTLSGLSPFFASSTTNTVAAATFTNTTFDNVSAIPTTGTNVSVRGLYLNPNAGEAQPLLAAKVRAHQ